MSSDDSFGSDVSIFDILLFVVGNIKILLIGSLLGGVVAVIATFYFSPKYESVAIQSGGPQLVAMYNSYQVLDAVVKQTDYAEDGEDADTARQRLIKDVVVSFNAKDKTVKLTVRGKNPQITKRVLEAWVERAAVLNQARLDDLQRLKGQFELAVAREREYDAAARKIMDLISTASRLDRMALVQSQVQLLDAARSAQATSASLASAIQQTENYELLQKPNLPTRSVPRNAVAVAVISFVGTGLLLLLGLFAKQAWMGFLSSPGGAEKVDKLKAAFR